MSKCLKYTNNYPNIDLVYILILMKVLALFLNFNFGYENKSLLIFPFLWLMFLLGECSKV